MTILRVKHNGQYLYVAGAKGDQGEPGPAGDAYSVLAGESISGHRALTLNSTGEAVYASADNISHVHRVIGMSTHAAISGADLEVLRVGEMTEPSWNWNLSLPIYLGHNGVLTQTVAAESLFTLVVGFPITNTKIYFSIQAPIIK